MAVEKAYCITSAISAKKINVFLQDLEKMILVLRQINLFLK
jgi:hypothetical protein